MIAASARAVQASRDAKVDRCVESGGIAEKPMRKVRGVRCALGAVPLSPHATRRLAAMANATSSRGPRPLRVRFTACHLAQTTPTPIRLSKSTIITPGHDTVTRSLATCLAAAAFLAVAAPLGAQSAIFLDRSYVIRMEPDKGVLYEGQPAIP